MATPPGMASASLLTNAWAYMKPEVPITASVQAAPIQGEILSFRARINREAVVSAVNIRPATR
jgi:hypothetical protein